MKKRGQFYLVAILIIVSLVIGLVSIQNQSFFNKKSDVGKIGKEIMEEKTYLLSYISRNNLDVENSNLILENFSKEYSDFLGNSKTSFFVWGNVIPSSTNSFKYILKNKLEEDEYILEISGINQTINSQGIFSTNQELLSLYVSGSKYDFILYEGQNIYYLIKYNYDEEVYIING